ncbi:MAG: hypothetical protein COU09_02025 [Candidatus Harrisonbacteria bacterium CG10_big_fil_rev_8_21_14_0_10_44_23]|uniref:DUF5678 domain-containing protein n=1 Tax=Candidatus Harrisonbacteria bacterium CG10_big_fil_rev_8_21_14_0_10_44_23 TaxID=1974585 RepID=A0A2H0UPV4_9BACT|nr:MAG: hypothetical protein COU09_02025 [Candidatus Harrisonbacteria bacterium CG10_big_fil_rev_8_21_14_0_10_44_23]
MKKSKVELREASRTWYARIENLGRVWGAGPTKDAALGDLVFSHPEKFGITSISVQPEQSKASA